MILKHENVQQRLIDSAICIIGTKGLDKTTTKAIVAGAGINEVYIYRHFKNKEHLLSKAFDKLDEELVAKAMLHIPVMYMQGLSFEDRCRFLFSAVWEFLLGNREKCLAFIRYYYSPYFAKYSSEEHKKRFEPLVQRFDEAFLEEANTWMLMNHILVTVMDFAVKVFDGALPNNEDTAQHVFRVIYHSVKPYFKRKEEC